MNVEEAAIIQLAVGLPPESEPVVLLVQKRLQTHGVRIDCFDRGVQRRRDAIPQTFWTGNAAARVRKAMQRAGGQRHLMLEIAQEKLRPAAADLDLPGLQTALEVVAQQRKQNLALQPRVGMVPVNVEKFGVGAGAALG